MINDLQKIPAGWKKVKLGEVIDIFDNKRIPLEAEYRATIKGNIPYCGTTGIIDFINNYIFDGEYVLIAEDGGKFGRFEETAYIMSGKFWVNNHAHIIKGKENILSNKFLMYFINYQDINNYISGSTREKLNQQLLRSIIFSFPPLPEQQKIAEILETVDKALEKTDKIIEKYKRMKQGLMQELLTKGIDNNWQIRSEKTHKFKDSLLGRIPADWEVKKLGEIGEILSGSTPDTSKDEYWNGDIVWITPDDLSKMSSRYFSTSERKITQKGLEKSSAKLISPGSIVISSRAPIGYLAISKVQFTTNQGCKSITLEINHNIDFFYYLLHMYVNKMIALGSGTTFNEISKSNLEKLKISFPPSKDEQERIASILSQVDAVIEKETAYRYKLSHIKQGLMEDLLTGKVRVTTLLANKNNQYQKEVL